jgi:hypothetical protein
MISSAKKSNKCDTTCRIVKLFEKLAIEEQRILTRVLNDWEKRDQRRDPRFPCSIITEYRALNLVHKDTIKNISMGGAFIHSSQRFPINLEIIQSFFIPNFEIQIQSKSQIIWTGPSGFGVQFEAIKSEK